VQAGVSICTLVPVSKHFCTSGVLTLRRREPVRASRCQYYKVQILTPSAKVQILTPVRASRRPRSLRASLCTGYVTFMLCLLVPKYLVRKYLTLGTKISDLLSFFQGDVVGCRVKFSTDGVRAQSPVWLLYMCPHNTICVLILLYLCPQNYYVSSYYYTCVMCPQVSPESIVWTRNGEHVGTKSLYSIPGLGTHGSMGAQQVLSFLVQKYLFHWYKNTNTDTRGAAAALLLDRAQPAG
jgi:hypothetical protein